MIIIRTEYIPGGFFAQILNRVFEILLMLEKHKIYPCFQIHSNLYGLGDNKDIIPYYLIHNYNYKTNNGMIFNSIIMDTFSYKYEDGNIVFEFIDIHKKWNSTPNSLTEANRLLFKYFDFADGLKNEISKLHTELFVDDNIVGLHYRGTDKMGSKTGKGYSESFYIDFGTTVKIIKQEFKRLNTNNLFVATDDSRILNVLKKRIMNINIITINHPYGTTPGVPLHRNPDNNNANDDIKYKIGSSAIIDCVLLSKCKCLIKYASQLSAYSAVINPKLQVFRVNKCNYGWFPENKIKIYKILPEISK